MSMSTLNSKYGSFLFKNDEIPTKKGEQSNTCTELSLKWKEGIQNTRLVFFKNLFYYPRECTISKQWLFNKVYKIQQGEKDIIIKHGVVYTHVRVMTTFYKI